MDWRGELIVLWFKVESEIVAHRKTRLIPRTAIEAPTRTAAMGVWLFAAAWSAQHESDGFVPGEEFERWDPNGDLTPYLVEVGYLEDAAVGGERGYRLHDWLDVQKSVAELEQARAYETRKAALHRDQQLTTEVRDRDKDRCRYCGALVRWNDRRSPIGATYDHVIPNGGNTIDNVVVCCRGCNSVKGGRTPDQSGMPLLPPGATGPKPTPIPRSSSDLDPSQKELTLDLAPTSPLDLEVDKEQKELKDLSDERRTPKPVTKRQEAGAPFEEFYAAYPRREKPEDAAKAYLQVTRTRKIPHSTVMAAVRRYAATRRGQDPQYTSLPASWLRGGAYENEPLRAVSSLNDY